MFMVELCHSERMNKVHVLYGQIADVLLGVCVSEIEEAIGR